MASWIAKACIQKSISLLPWKHNINYFFQKNITQGLALTDNLFQSKLNHCRQHLHALQKNSLVKTGFVALELGTGWYPVVPIGLFLSGASHIYSADIKSTLTTKSILLTTHKFLHYHRENKLQEFIPSLKTERISILEKISVSRLSKEALLKMLNIEILMGDVTSSAVSARSVHLINSNNTFEHIPPGVLKNILTYFKKIIHPDGVMSHFIDLSDHFSHLDKSISNYNFLKFSDTQWKLIDNTIQPQNRLRIPEYRKLLHESGWQIIAEGLTTAQSQRINAIRVAEKFKQFSIEELAVTHALLTCKAK